MRTRANVAVLLAGVLLAAIGIAACGGGSSSPDTASSGTATQQGTDRSSGELTGTPIKVMVITPYDNAVVDWSPAIRTAEAAAEAINGEGGVNGQPIEVVPCNDGYEPNKAVRCARQAQTGVTATIVDSLFTDDIFPILNRAEVPNVGGFVSEPIDAQARMAYPIFPGSNLINSSLPAAFQKNGQNSMFALIEARGSTAADVARMKTNAEHVGVEFIGSEDLAEETTDFAPVVQTLRESGAEATATLLADTLLTGLLRTENELGFSSPTMTQGFTIFPGTLEEIGPGVEGLLVLDQVPPASATGHFSSIAQFNEELEAAGSSNVEDRSTVGVQAWYALHAIALAAERVDGEVNNRTLVESLDSGGPIDLLGLLDWTPGGKGPGNYERLSNGELYLSEVQDAELILLDPKPIDGFAESLPEEE